MERMENTLIEIEYGIDSLTKSVDEVAAHLKVIGRQMILGNLPKELHKDQREYFRLSDDLELQQYMLDFYQRRLSEAKDDLSSDGFKFDIEKKKQRIEEIIKEMGSLRIKGCVSS